MLLPERMISTSITCAKTDVETALESLSDFGEFHLKIVQGDSIDLSEYKSVIQKFEEARNDVNSLIKQFSNKKEKLLDIFKDTPTTKTVVIANNWRTLAETTIQNISEAVNKTREITTSIDSLRKEIVQLNHAKEMLTCMETMNADFTIVRELKLFQVIFASVPVKHAEELQATLSRRPVYLRQLKLGRDANFICIITPNARRADIDRLLKAHHAEIFQAPENLPDNTIEAIEEINNRLKVNSEKEKELTGKQSKIGENSKEYFVWKETTENVLLLLKTKAKLLHFGSKVTIEGFIPQNKFNEFKNNLSKKLYGKVSIDKTVPNEQSHETPAHMMPPTKISNNRFVKPFEELTKLYGLPKYSEIDPTLIMAITFPILFGLMFGDLGHGLLLLIGGLVVGKLLKKNQGMKNLCFIMAACGIASCVTGILFGEIFGQEIFAPLWFSPFHDGISRFLIYCLYVGIAHIIVGLALEMGNFVLNHKIADAVFTSIPKIVFFIGGIYIIYNYWLDFGAWFSGPILAAIIPFIILVVGKPAYLAIAKPANHSSEHAEMDKISNRLFEGGDFFTRLLGNTISYARILALLMAHWALLLAVGAIAGLIGTASIGAMILSTIIIIFGNIFVLALEGLIVFIHTLRLHFYEWFSKFYMGTGIAFTPFKLEKTHADVFFEDEMTDKIINI